MTQDVRPATPIDQTSLDSKHLAFGVLLYFSSLIIKDQTNTPHWTKLPFILSALFPIVVYPKSSFPIFIPWMQNLYLYNGIFSAIVWCILSGNSPSWSWFPFTLAWNPVLFSPSLWKPCYLENSSTFRLFQDNIFESHVTPIFSQIYFSRLKCQSFCVSRHKSIRAVQTTWSNSERNPRYPASSGS